MNILVTGGEGFVGRYVVRQLESEGHEVTSIDIVSEDNRRVDVTNRHQVRAALDCFKPEAVVHLAALAGATGKGGGAESLKLPYDYLHANITGTLNVYEACRELGIRKVLCMSSFSPYGVTKAAIDEETPFSPNNPYGASKACVEEIARCYAVNYGIKTLIFRPPLICGEGQKEMNVLREFVFSALQDEPIVILGDGKHVREFVHPQDVGRAYSAGINFLCRMNKSFDILVLGNKPVSMSDLAQIVIKKVGKGTIEFRSATKQVFNQFTDHRKANVILGWKPSIDTEEIVGRVITDVSRQFCLRSEVQKSK
jgi:nucleoside-diphosphate-sugar epimerase